MSSLSSEREKQHSYDSVNAVTTARNKDTIGKRRRKRSNIIIATVLASLVVIIALAVGLGVGLTRNHKVVPQNRLPTAGTQDDQAGLQQSGSYFTSYDNPKVQFEWTETAFSLTSGGVPTSSSSSSNNPIIFINGSDVGQTMDGFGASLTDSSAQLFSMLKMSNDTIYNSVLDVIFNRRNGINILRIPIGSTDFSPDSLQYTMADQQGNIQSDSTNDTIASLLSNFNMEGANTYIIPFIKDALLRNSDLKINLLPWSPPAWMKTTNSVNSGTLMMNSSDVFTEYLVKSIEGFKNALNITPWSLSVQNEPSNPTDYPSMTLSNSDQINILANLRGRLAQVGLNTVQLWGHEDNYNLFSDAAALVNSNTSSLDGIAWHCYNGSSSLLSNYTTALTVVNKTSTTMHMSECSGLSGNGDTSSFDLQWWMNNIFSQIIQGISSITVWNLALNEKFGPRSSRAYCDNCVGSIEITNNEQVSSNLQMLLLSHHATVSTDLTRFGGNKASRLGTLLYNDVDNCIKSTVAFSARWNSTNSQRVGLVVQNLCQESVKTIINVNNVQHFDFTLGHGVTSIVLTL